MKEYIFYLTVCSLFIIVYEIVVVHGIRKTYIFFGISELVLMLLFWKALSINIGESAGIVILQFFLVLFIKKFNNNKERNKVYDIVSSSKFITIIFSGIKNLQEEEYQKIQIKLSEIINVEVDFIGRNYLFLSYKDKKVIVRYIFKKRNDYELYIEKNIIDIDKAKEIEYLGKGVSMVYICNI